MSRPLSRKGVKRLINRHSDVNTQLPVNWLYGAYIPKDVPLVPLNGPERFKLYIRQTYTTPGIYIKTGFFTLHDQVSDSPPAWEDGFSGFAKRWAPIKLQILCRIPLLLSAKASSVGNRAMIVAAAREGGGAFVTPSSEIL